MRKWTKLLDAKVTQFGEHSIIKTVLGWKPVDHRDFATLTTSMNAYEGQVLALLLVMWDGFWHYVALQQVVFVDAEPLQNSGEDCWEECEQRGGYCDWCGAGNGCCRVAAKHDPPECKSANFGSFKHHHCVDFSRHQGAICIIKNWGKYQQVPCARLGEITRSAIVLEFAADGHKGVDERQVALIKQAWKDSEEY